MFAEIALLGWTVAPLMLLGLGFSRGIAASVTVVGGLLLLPELVGWDIGFLPPFDKRTIPYLAAFVWCVLFRRPSGSRIWPDRLVLALYLALVGSALITAFSNSDVAWSGSMRLSGLNTRDGISLAVRDALNVCLPFSLGFAVCSRERHARELLRIFAIAGLVYTLLIAIELRLSPQLHQWVYGFHQHSWAQTKRQGGWRPMVFMHHGLAVALFIAAAAFAALSLGKAKLRIAGLPSNGVAAYLLVFLILCKSLAAAAYGFLISPALLTLKSSQVAFGAMVAGVFVITYPLIRSAELLPVDTAIEVARSVDEDRAESLETRIRNERMLLDRFHARPLFGWGMKSRHRIFDDVSARDITVTDGYWALRLSSRGAIGHAAFFGILVLPLLRLPSRINRTQRTTRPLLAGLAMVVGVYSLDLQLNGFFTPLPFYLSGALYRVTGGSCTRRGGKAGSVHSRNGSRAAAGTQ